MNDFYQNRVVAFLDIIGFSALVEELEKNPKLHSELQMALKMIGAYKSLAGKEGFAQKDLEISVFSDSIVISAMPDKINAVIFSCAHLQAQLAHLGILLRGAISSGLTIHEGDILYGKGMLNAYHMENSSSVYPRIVVDPELLSGLDARYSEIFLNEDHDGLFYVDFFSIGFVPSGAEALAAEGYDPYSIGLEEMEGIISRGISKSANTNHLMKWNWMKSKISRYSEFLQNSKMPKVDFRLKK